MNNRFTLKDFIFLVLFVLVIGAILWTGAQFGYQEKRLNAVQTQVQSLNDAQKEQSVMLGDIRTALRSGVQVNSATGPATAPAADQGRIRQKKTDGSYYVYFPQPPRSPRDPETFPDFARGDWLVRNLSDEPKVITPYIEKDYYGSLVQEMVIEGLLTRDPETFEYQPQLAESYLIGADGLTFTFKLRADACFSDGTPVTADDVIFSFKTIADPDVDDASLRSYFSSLKTFRKIDARTVEFVFDKLYFKALEMVGSLPILPAHVYAYAKGDDYNKRGDLLVGSGAFMLANWDRGQQIVLVRNEKYYGQKAPLDKMILKFIKNPQAAFQAFQNGQLDVHGSEPDQWVKFSHDPEFSKHVTMYKYIRPDVGYAFIGYNEAQPRFADKRVRQALTLLIDRQAIIHTFLKDLAVPATGPFSPLTPQNDPAIKPWPYDVDQAKVLLAQAGWKPGPDGVLARDGQRFEFDLTMGTGNPLGDRIANYVKEQFERAGIRMRITPYEFSVFTERLDERKFDTAFLSWSGSIEEDPYQIWHTDGIKDKGSNFIAFSNPQSDQLIEEGRKTLDDKRRMEIWHRWQTLIHEEQPYTFLYVPMSMVFINERFGNTKPYSTGLAYGDWFVPAKLQKYR